MGFSENNNSMPMIVSSRSTSPAIVRAPLSFPTGGNYRDCYELVGAVKNADRRCSFTLLCSIKSDER